MKQTFSCPSKNSLWIWLHQTSDKLTGSEDRIDEMNKEVGFQANFLLNL